MVSRADAEAMFLALPEVTIEPRWNQPSFIVRKKFFGRFRTDPDALVLYVAERLEREALLLGQPAAFFTTPHYEGHPYVLVRLEAVDPEELRELIVEGWRARAPKRLVAAYDAAA